MPNTYSLTITNVCHPTPDIIACGMPNTTELNDAAKQGIKTIINLCPQEETPADEANTVTDLGMQYINIPIHGPQDLTRSNAEKISHIMQDCEYHPLLIHCKSANRVGALLALKQFWIDGKPIQEAIEFGRTAGLTKLEATAIHIMQQSNF